MKAEFEVIKLDVQDIITTSTGGVTCPEDTTTGAVCPRKR